MTAHRTVIATVALLSLGAIAPVASATPVLSGYGGPGQGSQALLGSALLNGGGGGRGGGGGGTHLARDPSSAEPVTAAATAATTGSGRRAGATGGKRARASKQPAGSAPSPALPSVTLAEQGTAGSSGVLAGFSLADLLYTLFALLALATTAFATRWLAARPPHAGAGAKEISRHARSPE
jgi:hypothetical protein